MNRLLITELGDTMRTELKKEYIGQSKYSNKQAQKTLLPEIKHNFGNSALFMEMEKGDNPLYQKSLSDQALQNLSKVANLSLFGQQCKDKLENHIREDLLIKNQKNYLNVCLEKCVDKILDDKNLMTKRKRQLLAELKKLEAKEKFSQHSHMKTELSQFPTIVENTDRENKLMSIINAEGKLLQLQRRHEKQMQDDYKMQQQIAINYSKFKEGQTMYIEALPVLSHGDMEKDVEDVFQNRDLSSQRFHKRLNEKHIREKESIWKLHHFPKHHKRWESK